MSAKKENNIGITKTFPFFFYFPSEYYRSRENELTFAYQIDK